MDGEELRTAIGRRRLDSHRRRSDNGIIALLNLILLVIGIEVADKAEDDRNDAEIETSLAD